VREHRARLELGLTPQLRQDLQDELPRVYPIARRNAEGALRDHGEAAAADALPTTCPYTPDQITADCGRDHGRALIPMPRDVRARCPGARSDPASDTSECHRVFVKRLCGRLRHRIVGGAAGGDPGFCRVADLAHRFLGRTAEGRAAVVFNGWVEHTDPRSGQPTKACIASLQATKPEFQQINLAAIDPKQCFRALKGVAASTLISMAPVAPILQLNKKDPRFVASRSVSGSFDESTNIAAIGWEEFEHLVREIFAAEFTSDGGEVKVTQSSRDGGVDAIAFDPDPIRGGKIVIQAKRYTNPVDVSAVRDLYGTVVNEGATKGILVTTSSFGPDAYRSAKDKPLTLLDDGNLLHLLSKHGHKARIDLGEAKKLAVALKR